MSEPHDDELIEFLAERESAFPLLAPETDLLAQIQAEIQTLESRLRRPEPADPFRDEADCRNAIVRVAELTGDSSQPLATFAPEAGNESEASRSAPVETALAGNLGHYKLLAKLGEGGMGTVYRAEHTKLARVVAVKVLPADRLQDPQAVGRFEREMRAVGKLQHPNVVAAHDGGEIDGTHYLVMELVEGVDLGATVRAGRRFAQPAYSVSRGPFGSDHGRAAAGAAGAALALDSTRGDQPGTPLRRCVIHDLARQLARATRRSGCRRPTRRKTRPGAWRESRADCRTRARGGQMGARKRRHGKAGPQRAAD